MEFPPGRWRASWIWGGAPRIAIEPSGRARVDAAAGPCFVCFRRRFRVERIAACAPTRLTSDSRHVLWLNGIEMARGPVRGNPRRLHCDTVDLAPGLRLGDNVLAVLVAYYGQATPWWMPSAPTYSLGAGSLVLEACLDEGEWLVSDGSWRVRTSKHWRPGATTGMHAAPIESCDARAVPAGWAMVDFDDADWAAATELNGYCVGNTGDPRPPTHPFGPLPARPIPQLGCRVRDARVATASVVRGGAECDDPVNQVEGDEHSEVTKPLSVAGWPLVLEPAAGVALVTVDLGETVCGTIVLDADAPEGARFDVSVAEGLTIDGRLDRLDQHSGFRYVARGRDDRFESFDSMGFRFARIAVRGAREPVTLRPLRVVERLFPRPAGASFSCSDPLLEQIWTIGRRTVDLCSHDAYLDCPSREQRAWTGDSVVHLMVDLATNPDWSLARRHVELTASPRPDGMLPMAVGGDMEAADQTFIADWSLHWVRALHHLYRYTGDRDFVARMLGPAEGVLRWFVPFQGPDGLLADVTGWVLIDWSAVSVAGTSGALNALWARGLRDFAEMAEWIGDGGRAAWARGMWERVRQGFESLWDRERGLYVDHLVCGQPRKPVSQHTNAAAVCAGLVPLERVAALVGRLIDPDRQVRASWLLPGRTSAPEDGNMYAGALSLVTGPAPPWWDVERQIVAAQPFFRYVVHDAVALAGRAAEIPLLCRDWRDLVTRSATTWSETWFGGSRCHGWSSTPTRDLVVYTLGVTPAEPGFTRVRVAPALGDLEWASGRVPTPQGFVSLHVDAHRVEIECPVPLDVVLPGRPVLQCDAGRHVVPFPTPEGSLS